MTLKTRISVTLTIVLSVVHRSKEGVIPLESVGAIDDTHASRASSYMHFHGPVEGPEYEVKVARGVSQSEQNHLHLQHGQQLENREYAQDYVAHPKYEFSYGVEDRHTGDFHGQKETRNGHSVTGEYSVKEPGGTVRVVRYRADKDGFHAVVRTSGINEHLDGVYGGQSHAHAQLEEENEPEEAQEEHLEHLDDAYAEGYSVDEKY